MHRFEGLSSCYFPFNFINNTKCWFLFFSFPSCTKVNLNKIFVWPDAYKETEMLFEKLALPLANWSGHVNSVKNLVPLHEGISRWKRMWGSAGWTRAEKPLSESLMYYVSLFLQRAFAWIVREFLAGFGNHRTSVASKVKYFPLDKRLTCKRSSEEWVGRDRI